MLLPGLIVQFLLTFVGIELFRRFALKEEILLDVPNHRSNHSRVTVRGTGVVFVFTTLLGWGALACLDDARYLVPLITGAALIAVVSFVDDLRGLSISTRLSAQLAAALVFLYAVPVPSFLGYFGNLAMLWVPLAALFMVGIINIYNFMDGVDGLCAVHSLCVLMSWIIFSGGYEMNTETLLCLMLGFPLLAFLLHNWSPARVFMGDAGSTFLGFTFAALGVIQAPGILRSANFFTLLMLMMPFLFDATFTIVVRFLSGEKWYQAHNMHLFQRLLRLGLSHSQVASLYGLLTIYMGAIVSVVTRRVLLQPLIVIPLLVVPYLVLYFYVLRVERRTPEEGVFAPGLSAGVAAGESPMPQSGTPGKP